MRQAGARDRGWLGRCASALVVVAGSSIVLGACVSERSKGYTTAMGGSVTDLDRGTGALDMPYRGGVAGARDTTGVAITGWGWDESDDSSGGSTALPPALPPMLPPPSTITPERRQQSQLEGQPGGRMIAGPMQLSSSLSPERVSLAQRALAERGYFQGSINGTIDDSFMDAVRRFQADQRLPATGMLDAATAAALGLPPAAPPPPRGG